LAAQVLPANVKWLQSGAEMADRLLGKDPQVMTDEEFRLRQVRDRPAVIYERAGFPQYAKRVAAGEEGDCHGMGVADFFHD
jgi:hypothetical protein